MTEAEQGTADGGDRTAAQTQRHRILQWAWVAGTLVIVLAWANVVPVTVGWVGFGLALAASLASRWPRTAAIERRQP